MELASRSMRRNKYFEIHQFHLSDNLNLPEDAKAGQYFNIPNRNYGKEFEKV